MDFKHFLASVLPSDNGHDCQGDYASTGILHQTRFVQRPFGHRVVGGKGLKKATEKGTGWMIQPGDGPGFDTEKQKWSNMVLGPII